MGVGDLLSRVLTGGEGRRDELVLGERFGAGDLEGAVQRGGRRRLPTALATSLGGDRLDERRRQADRLTAAAAAAMRR